MPYTIEELERRNRELMEKIYGRPVAPPSTGEGNVDIDYLEAKQRELEKQIYGREKIVTGPEGIAHTAKQGTESPRGEAFPLPDIAGPISRFIERNKDWIWDIALAAGAAFLAPVFLSGKTLRMVRLGAFAYAAYVIYRNWPRIRTATWG